jgi:hypothetical protein
MAGKKDSTLTGFLFNPVNGILAKGSAYLIKAIWSLLRQICFAAGRVLPIRQ